MAAYLLFMKMFLGLAAITCVLLVSCGRNEPGTMGGEPGVPETVATGAPAEAAKKTTNTDPRQPALTSEHAASTFEDSASTNAATNASTNAASTNQSDSGNTETNNLEQR